EDAAIDQQLFERLFPAAIEDVFAGQVNGAVATRGGVHPVSGLHRIAFDQLKPRTKRLPGNTKAARQDDGMVAPLQELLDQPLSDQARAAGDEDAHRLTSWDGSTKTSEFIDSVRRSGGPLVSCGLTVARPLKPRAASKESILDAHRVESGFALRQSGSA